MLHDPRKYYPVIGINKNDRAAIQLGWAHSYFYRTASISIYTSYVANVLLCVTLPLPLCDEGNTLRNSEMVVMDFLVDVTLGGWLRE